MIPTAKNTIKLLEYLLSKKEGVTPGELIIYLDIPRSSLFSLLATVKSLGYIEQHKRRGRYYAGPMLLAWQGTSLLNTDNILSAFYQETLTSTIDETLALGVPTKEGISIISQVESKQRVHSSFDIGSNKTLLECAANELFISPPQKSIQSRGYHWISYEETIELAVPICSDGYNPSSVLLLSTPAYRHTSESLLKFLPTLRQMAARLSYRQGALVYAPYQQNPHRIEPTIPLTHDEITTFLRGPWAARLACIRPDGSPHIVPVWHEFDGDSFFIAAWAGSRWVDYVLTNPTISISVDEPWPPLRRISAKGKITPLSSERLPGGLNDLVNRLSQRYLGQSYQPRLENTNQRGFRFIPKSIRGWRGIQRD